MAFIGQLQARNDPLARLVAEGALYIVAILLTCVAAPQLLLFYYMCSTSLIHMPCRLQSALLMDAQTLLLFYVFSQAKNERAINKRL